MSKYFKIYNSGLIVGEWLNLTKAVVLNKSCLKGVYFEISTIKNMVAFKNERTLINFLLIWERRKFWFQNIY